MTFHHPKKVGRKDFARFFQRFFYMCVWLAERSRLLVRMCNFICAMVKSRYIGDGHPTFNRNPYNGYINPYYWVDDHPLLYGTIYWEFRPQHI